MLNKLKKALTYIYKKIKRGVEIVAEISKDIITGVSEVGKEVVSGTKDVINTVGTTAVNRYADYMDKKIDLGKSICNGVCNGAKTVCNGVKTVCNSNNRTTFGCILISIGLGISCVGGGFVVSGKINNKEV